MTGIKLGLKSGIVLLCIFFLIVGLALYLIFKGKIHTTNGAPEVSVFKQDSEATVVEDARPSHTVFGDSLYIAGALQAIDAEKEIVAIKVVRSDIQQIKQEDILELQVACREMDYWELEVPVSPASVNEESIKVMDKQAYLSRIAEAAAAGFEEIVVSGYCDPLNCLKIEKACTLEVS